MLVGSTATRLQGVAIDPGDVDVLIHPDTSDSDMTAIAAEFTRHANETTVSDDPDRFLSTQYQPLIATPDGAWLFGRWMVDGCKLEIARIRVETEPGALLETMGTGVWSVRRQVSWRGVVVPVVPLEVQLATSVSRGLTQRADAVRKYLLDYGVDQALLEKALADRGVW